MWNQCTVHGAVPNRSARFRVAQFVRGVRAGEIGVGESSISPRAVARAQAIRRELRLESEKGAEKQPVLTALAPHVFGISDYRGMLPGEDCPEKNNELHELSDSENITGRLVEKYWNI